MGGSLLRISARTSSVGMPRSITQVLWALPYWASIFLRKSRNVVLSTGITSQYLIGQRKTFWCDNQCDDHLHAITSLVPTVPELALLCFSDRRITFKIGTGQIIEENVKLGVEEIFPALSQVSKERPFVLQEQVVAFVKSVAFG